MPSILPKAITPLPLPSPLLWSQQPVALPSLPGVYWFLDANDKVLYVGKAKNLNNRLRSYGHLKQLSPKTRKLIEESQRVRYEALDSEFQALLIEAELIRFHQPHYNILLKDDKSPLYIVITKETYPKVISVRKRDLINNPAIRFFGPFSSGYQVKRVLTLARKIFPFCNASSLDVRHHKPCFYYHLQLCPGVCAGTINSTEYRKIIKQLIVFLQGKHKEVIKEITEEVETAVQQLDFETAEVLKRKIQSIEYVTRRKALGDDMILPDIANDTGMHRLIELRRMLEKVGIHVPTLERIETYDVANLQGESASVSMVTAIDGVVDHSEYKHFSIKTLKRPNDVGMLKEALTRRCRHTEWGIPSLIVVDGGRTQVNGAAAVIPWEIPVVGIAKSPDRLVCRVKNQILAIRMDPRNPGCQLIMQLRDEAHRFARRLHHKLSWDRMRG